MENYQNTKDFYKKEEKQSSPPLFAAIAIPLLVISAAVLFMYALGYIVSHFKF